MATKDPTTPVDDDDDNPAFMTYLEKNLPWLKEKLSLSSPVPPKSSETNPITDFLKEALAETKSRAEKLAEELEAARDLMTPEQLIQFKSRKSGGAGGQGNPPPSGGSGNEPPPPKNDDPPAKKKSRFL
jgi:hypothetical protein